MVFFFFFGGVTPEVRAVVKREAGDCPVCESPAAVVVYDNVLRLFLIPVWKWSGQNPAMKCTACPFLMPLDKFQTFGGAAKSTPNLLCWSYLSLVESASFKFCPHCGAPL